jgi:predicted dehydrogenase
MLTGRHAKKAAPTVAIIGAGLMGRWHLFTARKLGARIIGVVDPELAAARALAARAPGATALGDPTGLLDGEKPLLAHICTPTAYHFESARTLMAMGTHVLVEKPICQSADEARTLAALARDQSLLVCPVHQYAFQPGIERAIRWLAALGPIRHIQFSICSRGADHLPPGRRHTVVAEILPHPISILQRLVPNQLAGELRWSVAAHSDGEYFAHASGAGLFISISVSMNARPTCFLTRITTDGGTIEIDGFHGFATLLRGGASRATKLAAPFKRSSITLVAGTLNLARRLAQREPAYPGLANLVGRFYRAATSGDLRASPVSPDQLVQGSRIWSELQPPLPAAGVEAL